MALGVERYTIAHKVADDAQDGEDAVGKGSGGFKAQKEAEKREGAGNRAAWNTLFMRPDTVAAAVAEHYGVTRAELLDREASGAHEGLPSVPELH